PQSQRYCNCGESGLSFLNMHATKRLSMPCHWTLTLALLLISQGFALSMATPSDLESQVRAHFQAAREAEKAGDLEKAVSEYKAVLKLQPDEPVIYNNLGLVYHLQAKYRAAIEVFRQALKRDPGLLGANLF